jgi:hypothetical protein
MQGLPPPSLDASDSLPSASLDAFASLPSASLDALDSLPLAEETPEEKEISLRLKRIFSERVRDAKGEICLDGTRFPIKNLVSCLKIINEEREHILDLRNFLNKNSPHTGKPHRESIIDGGRGYKFTKDASVFVEFVEWAYAGQLDEIVFRGLAENRAKKAKNLQIQREHLAEVKRIEAANAIIKKRREDPEMQLLVAQLWNTLMLERVC